MRHRERGAAALLLSLGALSACVSELPPPAPSGLPLSTAPLLRAATAVLSRVSVYDYALAGTFAGERLRVVSPDRYAAALAPEHATIAELKDRIVGAAFAGGSGAAELVKLADTLVSVSLDVRAIGDLADEASFARGLADVDAAWSIVRDLAPAAADPELTAAIARGGSWRVDAATRPAFAVLTQPYDSRDEAQDVARRIGGVEAVADRAPFTVRVTTTDDRASADGRVADLRAAGILAATVEVQDYAFTRSGPDPAAELWREPAVDFPTWQGARRAVFIAGGGLVIASADGHVFSFDPEGRLGWAATLASGTSFATASTDGKYVVVGGQFMNLLSSDGKVFEPALRLPSAAAGAVYVDKRRVFVAASQGPTGRPEGGGGGVAAMDLGGETLAKPFPLVTPAAGPALATSRARDDVLVATTSAGVTDLEAIRPGVDDKVRTVLRVPGQVAELALDADAMYGVIVTAEGTYRFRPGAADAGATLERLGAPARDVAFAPDGTLYLVLASGVVAYDRGLRALWTLPLADGRRVVVARRVVVQDGLSRVLAVDAASGVADELAAVGDLNDVVAAPDGARVLLLAGGQRAVVFQLP